MTLPYRKHPRLKNYEYGPGCYHLTICTRQRKPLLSRILPAENPAAHAQVVLLPAGKVADTCIQNIPKVYAGVHILKYAIMPNHIHLLIQISDGSSATVPTIIRGFKRKTGIELNASIWQDSFYDVVIRNDVMFRCEWNYIDSNPDKWAEDNLYISK